MNKLVLLIFISLCTISSFYGQSEEEQAPLSYVVQDAEIDSLWDKWLTENHSQEEFRAWRILVVGVESRRALNNEIKRFERSFPEMPFNWEYDPPFYKLKTGAFTERLEAKPLLYKIKEEFPGALEIRDDVAFENYFEEKAP
jgi:hypothetical protein